MLKVYIAASWKHKHAVEMLTAELRKIGFEVLSFVENNNAEDSELEFEEWVNTEYANKSFAYDTTSAMKADITIYIGPSGKDAAAEVGIAYAMGKHVFALYAKGEDFGLMRKLFNAWFDDYRSLLEAVTAIGLSQRTKSPFVLEPLY